LARECIGENREKDTEGNASEKPMFSATGKPAAFGHSLKQEIDEEVVDDRFRKRQRREAHTSTERRPLSMEIQSLWPAAISFSERGRHRTATWTRSLRSSGDEAGRRAEEGEEEEEEEDAETGGAAGDGGEKEAEAETAEGE
jgi:hypothetical protein